MSTTPTTLTPEELAATLRHYADGMTSLYEPIHRETLTRWAQAATTAEAALSASQERERVMRDLCQRLADAWRQIEIESHHPPRLEVDGNDLLNDAMEELCAILPAAQEGEKANG